MNKETKITDSFVITKGQQEGLVALAEATERSKSYHVRKAIAEYLKQQARLEQSLVAA